MFIKSTYLFVFAIGVASVSAGLVDLFGEEEVEETRERRQVKPACSSAAITAAVQCCNVKEIVDDKVPTSTQAPLEAGRKRRAAEEGVQKTKKGRESKGKEGTKGKKTKVQKYNYALKNKGMLIGEELNINALKNAYPAADAAQLEDSFKFCNGGVPQSSTAAVAIGEYRAGLVYNCMIIRTAKDACAAKSECQAESNAIDSCDPLIHYKTKNAKKAKGATTQGKKGRKGSRKTSNE